MELTKELAEVFAEMLCGNEENMGEQAAFHVTCSQLELTEEEGYELLEMYCGEPEGA